MSEMTAAMLVWGVIITVLTFIRIYLRKQAEKETEQQGPVLSREEQARIDHARFQQELSAEAMRRGKR